MMRADTVVLKEKALRNVTIVAAAACGLIAPAAAQTVRSERTLADGWSFHRGDTTPEVAARASGAEWQPVSVPHTWNRVGYYLPDPATRQNRVETIDKYQGVGWYRLPFTAPREWQGRKIWLQFDAASRTAEVWLNGKRIGSHAGGFSRFRLDAGSALRPGEANLLLVKVDNTQPDVGASTVDVLPLAGDFFVHGGLYRPVSIVTTDPVHIDMLDSGGPGVFATTRTLNANRALVDVAFRPRNDGATPVAAQARVRLLDARGRSVATATRPLTLVPGTAGEDRVTLDVVRPHLWNGVADPYLHRLVVELISKTGKPFDRVELPFGIREMRADATHGFLLNGKPLRLHGVGYHQDREGKGWAVSAADIADDFAIMRDMGVNTIRLTHYQHGQPIHDLADRYGMILWDEIPLVSRWTLGKDMTATAGLRSNARQQLREMIRQNGNHASVFNWGIANEVDFGKTIPIFITSKDGPAPDPMPLLNELHALAKAEDPTRPDALATCCERDLAPGSDVPITAPAADLGGANRYYGWYYGAADELGAHLDTLHAKRPQQPLSLTEYGAGGATSIHTDNPAGGRIDAGGATQPEEYQSYVHERAWAAIAPRPFLWATWLWNSFDFATTVRKEGDAIDINTKGLVTYDRKVKKDAYYFYRANWSAAPTMHITGRRYVDRAYPVTDVRVYSNAATTTLSVNGRRIGTLGACPQKVCVFPAVRLTSGTNRIVARGTVAGKAVTDEVAWQLAPASAEAIRIDSGAIVAATATGRRFGSDAFFDGGQAANLNEVPAWGPRPAPKVIAGTSDQAIVQTYREGTFGYRIPLSNGRYTVTLTFVEPAAAPGERRFDVVANGQNAIAALDVAAAGGKPLVAITRQFPVDIRDNLLDLRFVPRNGKAIVSAIEITR